MALQAILRLTEPRKTILATKTAKKSKNALYRFIFILKQQFDFRRQS
jgi:hypothetical protein